MNPTSFYAALNLSGRPCLVIGEARQIERRVQALLECGAKVTVLCDEPDAHLLGLEASRVIALERRPFHPSDLSGMWLAVLASPDGELADRVAAEAEAQRVFFCAVDHPGRNTFTHLALARAGVVTIAIGTEGRAPSLSRKLKDEFESLIQRAGLSQFAEKVAHIRREAPPETRAELAVKAVSEVRLEGNLRLELPRVGEEKNS